MVTRSFEEISEAIDQFLEVMHKHELSITNQGEQE